MPTARRGPVASDYCDDCWLDEFNWTPDTIPNGPADTATFDVSNVTGIGVYDDVEVNGIVFTPGASAFTIYIANGEGGGDETDLIISGVGITNNSPITQNLMALSG